MVLAHFLLVPVSVCPEIHCTPMEEALLSGVSNVQPQI